MIFLDKILIITFLFAIIVWQALHQAHLFKQNKTISHFWKGVWYALAVGLATIPYILLYDWWYALKVPLIGILERLALFDFTLNIARKKQLFYNGEGSTNSDTDKVENKWPQWVVYSLKGAYVAAFIIIVIFIK
jgi:hypothetical protein